MTIALEQPRRRPIPVVTLSGIALAAAALGFVAAYVSVYAAAVPYAVGFMALTWLRPDLALMLMLASSPFAYDLGVGPVKIALSDISLVLAMPVLMARARQPLSKLLRLPVLAPALLYFGVCAASTILNGAISEAITSMVQMGLYLIVTIFVFSCCVRDPKTLYSAMYGLVLAGVVLAGIRLITGDMFAIGLHKNSIGSSLAFATIAALELWLGSVGNRRRRRLFGSALVLILLALVTSLSRGAWLGAIVGAVIILLLRARFRLTLRFALLAIPVVVTCWIFLPAEAKEYATDFSAAAHNVKARLMSIDFAYSVFSTSPLLGVGVGLRKQYDATNIIMSTLAETGVVGVTTFLLIFVAFGYAVWRARLSLRVTDPHFSLLAIGTALMCCKLAHGMVDHFWGRGALPAWAGAGMALAVYLAVTGKPRAAEALRQ
jgi:putative inorganic carbon (hco3(-)) transporter